MATITFSTENFVKLNLDKNFSQCLQSLDKEIKYAENLLCKSDAFKRKNTDIMFYQIPSYIEHLKDFYFFLMHGALPYTTGKEGIKKFAPILDALVSRGDLNAEFLNSIQ